MQPQYIVPQVGFMPAPAQYPMQYQQPYPVQYQQQQPIPADTEVVGQKQKPKPKAKAKKQKRVAIHPAGVGKMLLFNDRNVPISSTPVFLDRRVAIHSEKSGIVAAHWPSNARPLPKEKAKPKPKPQAVQIPQQIEYVQQPQYEAIQYAQQPQYVQQQPVLMIQ
jgi:hypothetical protein